MKSKDPQYQVTFDHSDPNFVNFRRSLMELMAPVASQNPFIEKLKTLDFLLKPAEIISKSHYLCKAASTRLVSCEDYMREETSSAQLKVIALRVIEILLTLINEGFDTSLLEVYHFAINKSDPYDVRLVFIQPFWVGSAVAPRQFGSDEEVYTLHGSDPDTLRAIMAKRLVYKILSARSIIWGDFDGSSFDECFTPYLLKILRDNVQPLKLERLRDLILSDYNSEPPRRPLAIRGIDALFMILAKGEDVDLGDRKALYLQIEKAQNFLYRSMSQDSEKIKQAFVMATPNSDSNVVYRAYRPYFKDFRVSFPSGDYPDGIEHVLIFAYNSLRQRLTSTENREILFVIERGDPTDSESRQFRLVYSKIYELQNAYPDRFFIVYMCERDGIAQDSIWRHDNSVRTLADADLLFIANAPKSFENEN